MERVDRVAERGAERALSNRDLIKFYQFKRTVLFFDEWGFYILLLTLYQYSYPLWLILPILFYGGGAIFTAYVNLNKVESEIIDVDQDIYVFKDLISNLYQLNLEMVQRAFIILSDYVNRKTQNLKVSFETHLNRISGSVSAPVSDPMSGSLHSPPSESPSVIASVAASVPSSGSSSVTSSTSTFNESNDLVMEDIDSNENILKNQ